MAGSPLYSTPNRGFTRGAARGYRFPGVCFPEMCSSHSALSELNWSFSPEGDGLTAVKLRAVPRAKLATHCLCVGVSWYQPGKWRSELWPVPVNLKHIVGKGHPEVWSHAQVFRSALRAVNG